MTAELIKKDFEGENMVYLKSWLKKEKVKMLVAAAAIAIVFLALRHNTGIFRNLSDFFCIIGLVYIVVGSSRYIRNVGLFKTFSYLGYRRRWKSSGALNGEAHPMSLGEYTQNIIMDEARQKPVTWVMGFGILWCTVSFLFALAC